jgi:tetratricopeptide (TPR) repeat protein
MAESADRPGRAGESPAGGVYDWYVSGLALLESGNPAAAAQVLRHAVGAEPASHSLREALGRAEFDARMYDAAAATFAGLVEADPADHYARFGLGLSLSRLGRPDSAVEHLALATAMRPDLPHYAAALRGARATVRARKASA